MAKLVELWREADPPAGAVYDVGALEFDPLKINQECSTYFELMLRDRVNQAARAVTLAFASGSDLDAIATRYPGGVPRLPDETDDRYRRRIQLSPNAFTPHGTGEAYVFWALTADPTLRDASASTREGTGIVTVTVMAEGDDPQPTMQQLLDVRAYIMDQGRKGLTDELTVIAPVVVDLDYHICVWFYPGPEVEPLLTQLRSALEALREKQRWLGYDHTLLAINGALAVEGVHHIEIEEPAEDVFVSPQCVVRVTSITVEYMGRAE